AFGADGVDQVVDARSDLAAALGCAFAPVLIPHVADDDGGFGGIPGEGFFGDLIALARAGDEVEFFGESGSGGQKNECEYQIAHGPTILRVEEMMGDDSRKCGLRGMLTST